MEDETRNQALLSGSNAGSTCEEQPVSSSNGRSTCEQRPASSNNSDGVARGAHHPRQGEADSHRHGFLCLCQPIIEISINGFTPQLALHKQQQH